MSVLAMASAPTTLSARIMEACAAARHSPRAAVRVTEGELELSFALLEGRRLLVVGTRPHDDFAPMGGRAADGTPSSPWHIGISRYYDLDATDLDREAWAESVLADFTHAAFDRARVHHTSGRA